MTRTIASVVLFLAAATAATGCRFSPFRELGAIPPTAIPGKSAPTRASDDVGDRETADGLFVGVCVSGGGSRASVFAGEVLLALHELGAGDRFDCLSSVSGGSIAAAHYCLSRDPGEAGPTDIVWNAPSVHAVTTFNYWTPFLLRGFSPVNAWRYCFTGYNRSCAMADVFDDYFYKDRRFADLNPKRPRLLINATRLDTGGRFTFTDAGLAEIGIDSAKLRVADAVQASTAYPGFFHTRAFPRFEAGSSQPAGYLHLMDGGVFENLGVLGLLDVYRRNRAKFPKGAVLVVVDAGVPLIAPQNIDGRADLREGIDYFLDLVSAKASLDIITELVRKNTLHNVQESGKSDNLRVIHLYYPSGLLPKEGETAGKRRAPVFDVIDPLDVRVEFAQLVKLLAPTSLSIDDHLADLTRLSARRVVERALPQLRAAGVLPAP